MKAREAERSDIKGSEYGPRERLAGAFVIIAILLLLGALAFSGQIGFLLADTFTLHAEIDTAEGVESEAAVKYAGIEIGKVTNVELTSDRKVMLQMKIRERYHDIVREDSVARINRMAILGDVTVEVTRGDRQLPVLADGAQIPVEQTPTLDEMLSRLPPAIEDIIATAEQARRLVESVEPEVVRGIVSDLESVMNNASILAAKINDKKGIMGRLFNDEKMARDLAAITTELAKVLKLTRARLQDIEPLLDNTETLSREVTRLVNDANVLVNTLTETVSGFDASQGDAISGLLIETRRALDQAEETLRAIRNTWPFSGNAPESERVEPVPPQPPPE